MGYYVKVEENVKLYVEDLNPTGCETIVFLHGWPADYTMFEYQFAYLIQKGFRCVGIDQRGFGRSDKPADGYDYNRLADDVYGVIGVTRCYLGRPLHRRRHRRPLHGPPQRIRRGKTGPLRGSGPQSHSTTVLSLWSTAGSR